MTISEIQQALKAAGFDPGDVDGLLGPRTTDALKLFQGEHGLPVSGAADAPTLAALAPGAILALPSLVERGFKGGGLARTPAGFAAAVALIGCEPAALGAVLAVEAAGSGFDKQGRPKLLFEPHLFHRALAGAKRTAAVKQGLAYPKWGEKPYPKDSYPRLVAAVAIDEMAALSSASWGLGQLLGSNHGKAGYASPQLMVEDFMRGEDRQLLAMAKFIAASGLDDELRRRDFAGFARGYNGPGYARNHYDTKLVLAHARELKRPTLAA